MNKYKKLAIAAVSMAMAGTMAISLAACGGGDGGENEHVHQINPGTLNLATIDQTKLTTLTTTLSNQKGGALRQNAYNTAWGTAKEYWEYLSTGVTKGQPVTSYTDTLDVVNNTTGDLNYSTYSSREKVTLGIAIGHNSNKTGAFYGTGDDGPGTGMTLPDGNTYANNALKPAWVQMGKDLNIDFTNTYDGKATSANLDTLTGTGGKWDQTDMFTADLSKILDAQTKETAKILNLGDYLEYMPNFQKFLNDNPIVYLSLLQEGMNTTTGEGKSLYVAPYFDGNDDIERYTLVRKDIVEKLLNGDEDLEGSDEFSQKCNSDGAKVSAYFGGTNYNITSLTSDGSATQTITKDYTAALAAVKDSSTALGQAYMAIVGEEGEAYDGTSGNIVDIMNAAIAGDRNVHGNLLVNLYRAYIDVAYKVGSNPAYTAATRANLFNGYDAAWDVDDLVALLRCALTNSASVAHDGYSLVGIAPRDGTNDRTPDMVRLAAALYGVRGADSRLENTYIAADGTLKDARNDKEFYEAFALMNTLKQENLVADYSAYNGFSNACGYNTTAKREAVMMYDYSQTQTKNYFKNEDSTLGTPDLPGAEFGPIINPIAKWSVNSADDTIMRFTESWRSTKTGGLGVNADKVLGTGASKDTNPVTNARLAAVLQFIDYLYSEDGQITSTFGPMAEDADGTNGFWYNTEATAAQISAGQYFTYKGTKYYGTLYKGRYTPTITDAFYASFTGADGNTNALVKGAITSFTDYARMLVGSTLPVGVKDQSFENQCTAKMGKDGADIVSVALAAGVVKGMTLEIDSSNYWYTVVPTALPVASNVNSGTLNNSTMNDFKYMTGEKKGDSKNFFSIMNYIILNGLNGTYNQQEVEYVF